MLFTVAYVLTIFGACSLAQTITFGTYIVAAPPSQPPIECRCVNAGTCVTIPTTGFDLRIVNHGETKTNYTCPTAGQVLCCGEPAIINDGTCGIRKITNSASQLVGTAQYGSYPWQAALVNLANEYLGSGVLLTPLYVLTAAHKVYAFPNRNFKVVLGVWNTQQNAHTYPHQEYSPIEIVTHPQFSMNNLQNDIALIKLNKIVPIATSPNINCAPMAKVMPSVGTRCWVSGWGKDAFDASGQYQTSMKEVDVLIVDQETCETRMRNTRLGPNFVLDRTFMCAGGVIGKDACTGDGGAPLVCPSVTGQWQIVGIVAWGIGCAEPTVPGVYVNVPIYRDWINKQIGITG